MLLNLGKQGLPNFRPISSAKHRKHAASHQNQKRCPESLLDPCLSFWSPRLLCRWHTAFRLSPWCVHWWGRRCHRLAAASWARAQGPGPLHAGAPSVRLATLGCSAHEASKHSGLGVCLQISEAEKATVWAIHAGCSRGISQLAPELMELFHILGTIKITAYS